jgi:hypothetical protein
MSKRSPHAAVRNVLMSLTILGTLPAMAASGLDGPAGQAKTPAPPAVQLRPSRPARPAVRTPASFTPQMPLSEAIDILRNCTSPPLNIVVLWKDLDSAGIYRDTPIGIDGIPGLRLGRYLELLVLSLSAGATTPIGYTVQNGVVIISTTVALPAPRYVTRVYDIRDLTAPPANYFFPPMGFGNMGYGGMGPGMYGGSMMGPGGYGGGFGPGPGMGPSYAPSGLYGPGNAGGLPGLIGNSYGPRGR